MSAGADWIADNCSSSWLPRGLMVPLGASPSWPSNFVMGMREALGARARLSIEGSRHLPCAKRSSCSDKSCLCFKKRASSSCNSLVLSRRPSSFFCTVSKFRASMASRSRRAAWRLLRLSSSTHSSASFFLIASRRALISAFFSISCCLPSAIRASNRWDSAFCWSRTLKYSVLRSSQSCRTRARCCEISAQPLWSSLNFAAFAACSPAKRAFRRSFWSDNRDKVASALNRPHSTRGLVVSGNSIVRFGSSSHTYLPSTNLTSLNSTRESG
mmetsp:Transcript_6293/g.13567  ORF Transcript_6293/g.13567 Transcript_6293/m.13567 type:complete len:271 (+) Transcript_6293:1589-2401(+)